jgi:two-component system sensor histidine kinase KdpD
MGRALTRCYSSAAAVLGVLLLGFVCFRFVHAGATVAATLLLLIVLLIGTYARLPEAISASLAATVCLDYWFIPPIGSITIGSPDGWIVLLVFLLVSLLITNLSRRLRIQRNQLSTQQAEAEKLYSFSRAILLAEDNADVVRVLLNKCVELFDLKAAALYVKSTDTFYRSHPAISIADDLLRISSKQGLSRPNLDEDGVTLLPLNLGNKSFGKLAFQGACLSDSTLHSLANTISLAIAHGEARQEGNRAEAVRKSEELKSVMIDALTHDFKTPLTVIDAACDVLTGPAELTAEQRKDLTEVIQQESKGLKRTMDEAIHMARIDAKRFRLHSAPVAVASLVDMAVASLGSRASSHRINVEVSDSLAVLADADLIAQALKQLLDNAIK